MMWTVAACYYDVMLTLIHTISVLCKVCEMSESMVNAELKYYFSLFL